MLVPARARRQRTGPSGDRRRLVYCLCGALALHASGLLAYRGSEGRAAALAAMPGSAIPIALDEAPELAAVPAPRAPEPPAEPDPPVEPEPPPMPRASPPPDPAEEPAAEEPEPEREPVEPHDAESAKNAEASLEPGQEREPKARRRARRKLAEDATAFGGEAGAFSATVCFVSRSLHSARAVDGCKPVASFSTNEINVSPRRFKRGFPGVEDRVAWFGIDFRGNFKVRAAGYYTFRLVSDDGAVLFIDGEPVIDNDGRHPPREARMALPLSAGDHEFRLLYFQGPGDRLALQLFVKGYKTPERLFGPEF